MKYNCSCFREAELYSLEKREPLRRNHHSPVHIFSPRYTSLPLYLVYPRGEKSTLLETEKITIASNELVENFPKESTQVNLWALYYFREQLPPF